MPKSSKEKTKNYDDEAQKKVRTIQRTLRNQITFKVDKVDEAFNDKVKSITIVPKYVGRDFDDLDHAVYKAFMLAEKQLDNNKRYKFFTLFENNGGDKPFHVRTTTQLLLHFLSLRLSFLHLLSFFFIRPLLLRQRAHNPGI